MYKFVTGPLAWLSFAIFIGGVIYRAVWYIRGLDWQMDRVAYKEHFGAGMKGAIKSVRAWLTPFGTHSWRYYPFMTVLFFTFHIGLIVTPIFLQAHNIILKERFGICLFSISDKTADMLTIAMLLAGVFLILRRLMLPEVRILTTKYDYAVLAITTLPFLTGFLAAHNIGNYDFWVIVHVLCGEAMLIAVPFTKLSHFVLFFMSRAQIGMDFGIKRGGMKNPKGFAW